MSAPRDAHPGVGRASLEHARVPHHQQARGVGEAPIRELSATILLFTARTKTVSVTMFDLRESNDWGPIAVLSITMLIITFAMVGIVHRFTDRRPT